MGIPREEKKKGSKEGGWRVAREKGRREGRKREKEATSTSFLSTSWVHRVYPLELRPGNLIPFSIYLNPLTQTRLLGLQAPLDFPLLLLVAAFLAFPSGVPPLFRPAPLNRLRATWLLPIRNGSTKYDNIGSLSSV